MGLTLQFGHPASDPCPAPDNAPRAFTVVHLNGIHKVSVKFCGCHHSSEGGSWRQQLLRRRWYPATHIEPQTCCTFRVLEVFHILTLEGKVTSYDYYSGLEKLTDNLGSFGVQVCIERLMSLTFD